ncbi:unnamed protein product [Brassicogethes aeneus]|uniref:PWWP domain-containing protein n=1 Tax=Brassicogethes aeneus TaxID=1431903 RepID=A0A9P0AW20_BRAAE|nr:unnamed protein product [Brassicogethes aeneus]
MKKAISFKPGDKVFAKVKGYPPWPASIQSENGKKYNVKFYGTGEIGTIKAEDLFYFIKSKNTLKKVLKRKDYNDAMAEIEEAIKNDGGDGESNSDDLNISAVNTTLEESEKLTDSIKKGKRKRSGSDSSLTETKSKKANVTAESTPVKSPKKKATEEKEESTEAAEETLKSDEKTDTTVDENDETNTTTNEETVENAEANKTATEEKEVQEVEDVEMAENIPEEAKKDDSSKEDKTEEINANAEKPKPSKTKNKVEEVAKEEFNIHNYILTTEKSLKNNILFAEHVKAEEKYYAKISVDQPLIDYKKSVLPVKLTTGKYAGIKLTQIPKPQKFKGEYQRAMFDKELSEAVLKKSEEISKLDKAPTEDYIIQDLNTTEEQINEILNDKEVELKQKRLVVLKDEAKLVVLEKDIKLTLGLDTADPEKALVYLEDMLKLRHVDRIMLLKHYHVLEMVKRLKIYYGNIKEWNLSEESLEKFQKDAEMVRKKAEEVFKMLMKLFPEFQEKDFWEGFTDTVAKFREECKDLTESQVGVLWAPPKSRRTFMDLLEEQALTESESAQRDNSKETEKENSSEIANSEKVIEVSETEQEVV